MKCFEQTIKKRIHAQVVKAVGVGIFAAFVLLLKLKLYGDFRSINYTDVIMLFGFLFGGAISSLVNIARYRKALKTPEALEQLYVTESDERNRIISLKTCRLTIRLTCALLGVAGVVASFFSTTVVITIGCILIWIVLAYRVLAVHYSKQF